MKPIEIVTETKTSVTHKGNDVNEVLQKVCLSFHEILTQCSIITDKINNGQTVEYNDLIVIEGYCCEMLDYLDD